VSLQYTVRPISDRTAFTGKHAGSLFTVKWHQVLDLLQREYEALNGRHLVIEVDVEERAIRNDGGIYANAKAATPAVRVAFESKHGPITMATDRFVRQTYRNGSMDDWQHNVYAIAKSLEALRLVDRYGVTKRGEQYTGWKAIGAGTGLAPTSMTTDRALQILADESGLFIDLVDTDGPALIRAVKLATLRTHPDRNNGERSRYDAVDQARQVLERARYLP
jgi:hypothetical protein